MSVPDQTLIFFLKNAKSTELKKWFNNKTDEELKIYLDNNINANFNINAFPGFIPVHMVKYWGNLILILKSNEYPKCIHHLNSTYVNELQQTFDFLYSIIRKYEQTILNDIRNEFNHIVDKNYS